MLNKILNKGKVVKGGAKAKRKNQNAGAKVVQTSNPQQNFGYYLLSPNDSALATFNKLLAGMDAKDSNGNPIKYQAVYQISQTGYIMPGYYQVLFRKSDLVLCGVNWNIAGCMATGDPDLDLPGIFDDNILQSYPGIAYIPVQIKTGHQTDSNG